MDAAFPDCMACTLRRLTELSKQCLKRHATRMRTEPEYREVVEGLMKLLLPERPGRVGETFRIVRAGHAFLVKVL